MSKEEHPLMFQVSPAWAALSLPQVPVQAVRPGAAAERRPQHGRPDVEHGEGAAGQRAVLRQGEPGLGLQVLHVPDAHHEAGGPQPDHGESPGTSSTITLPDTWCLKFCFT